MKNPVYEFKKAFNAWSKFEQLVVFPLFVAIMVIAFGFAFEGNILGAIIGACIFGISIYEMTRASKRSEKK